MKHLVICLGVLLAAAGCTGARSDLWDPVPVFEGDGSDDPEPAPDLADPIDAPDTPEGTDPVDTPVDPAPDDGPLPDVNLCELPCNDYIDCTQDTCEPAVGCVFTPRNERCTDGIDCTVDQCVAGEGCRNTPHDELCGDGAECTLDRCDVDVGACTFTPRHEMCADAFDCTVDLCTPYAGCQSRPDDSRCGPGERCDPACGGCILDVAPAGRFLAHSSSSLYQIDPAAPSGTYVGDIGYSVTDIAVTSDNMLWGITFTSLLVIDYCTGTGSFVGDVGGTSSLNALVSAPDGMLFGADYGGDVWRIDPATGRGTRIGSYGAGLSSSGDLAYGPDDRLYGAVRASWSSNDLLIAVNPVTGRAALVGDIGFPFVYGLAVLSGVLYGLTDAGQLITISMATGRGTLVGTVGSSFWGAASPPPRP
jgi:hypothetical protein